MAAIFCGSVTCYGVLADDRLDLWGVFLAVLFSGCVCVFVRMLAEDWLDLWGSL